MRLWQDPEHREYIPVPKAVDVISFLPDMCTSRTYSQKDLDLILSIAGKEFPKFWEASIRKMFADESLLDYCW